MLQRWLSLATAAALLAGSANPAAALSFAQINVTGDVYTSLDNGLTQTPNVVSIATLANGSVVGTQSGAQSESFNFGPGLSQSFAGVAEASADAFADQGVLRIRASAGALASPLAYVAPFPGALGNNPYAPRANAGFFAAFREDFVLSDPTGTLAIGTPVTYHVTVILDSVVAGDYSGNLQIAVGHLSSLIGGTFIRSSSAQFSLGDHFVFSHDVAGRIGDTHVFTVSLVAGANAAASLALGRQSQFSLFDASSTVNGYLDPVTAGLVLQTESGHDFRSVPEPGALALAGLIGAMGFARHRR